MHYYSAYNIIIRSFFSCSFYCPRLARADVCPISLTLCVSSVCRRKIIFPTEANGRLADEQPEKGSDRKRGEQPGQEIQ